MRKEIGEGEAGRNGAVIRSVDDPPACSSEASARCRGQISLPPTHAPRRPGPVGAGDAMLSCQG